MRSLTRLDVDGVVGFEPVGLDNLVPLDEFPHLLSGELFRRIHWRSCKREISVGTQSKTLETVWPLCLTSGSLSHSASLHSLVTLLCVVELLSLKLLSLLRSGGGGGNSSSACNEVDMKSEVLVVALSLSHVCVIWSKKFVRHLYLFC